MGRPSVVVSNLLRKASTLSLPLRASILNHRWLNSTLALRWRLEVTSWSSTSTRNRRYLFLPSTITRSVVLNDRPEVTHLIFVAILLLSLCLYTYIKRWMEIFTVTIRIYKFVWYDGSCNRYIRLIIKPPLAVTSHLSAFNRVLCASNIFSDHWYR